MILWEKWQNSESGHIYYVKLDNVEYVRQEIIRAVGPFEPTQIPSKRKLPSLEDSKEFNNETEGFVVIT